MSRDHILGIPREKWKCGNCIHLSEAGEPPPLWMRSPFNCSRGTNPDKIANQGPCMHWWPKPLTDEEY